MSSAVIISIKPVFARQIIAGTKTIELRRSYMGLSTNDIVLVYISAPDQCLGMWFRIASIDNLSIEQMWARHKESLGIDYEQYLAYFEGAYTAMGLHVGEVHQLDPPLPLAEIQKLVPGFVPPQGMIRLHDSLGRYEKLLSKLPVPLPSDVFAQQDLFRRAK